MLYNILKEFFKVEPTGSTGLGYDYTGLYGSTGLGYDYIGIDGSTGIGYAPTESPIFINGSSNLKGSSSPLESLKCTEMPEPELEIFNPLRKIQW
jgi:hypothetical protein